MKNDTRERRVWLFSWSTSWTVRNLSDFFHTVKHVLKNTSFFSVESVRLQGEIGDQIRNISSMKGLTIQGKFKG